MDSSTHGARSSRTGLDDSSGSDDWSDSGGSTESADWDVEDDGDSGAGRDDWDEGDDCEVNVQPTRNSGRKNGQMRRRLIVHTTLA